MDTFSKNSDQYSTLDASGLAVGLPDGLMGNSEVGHLNIGAGRAIYQVSYLHTITQGTCICNCNHCAQFQSCNYILTGKMMVKILGFFFYLFVFISMCSVFTSDV